MPHPFPFRILPVFLLLFCCGFVSIEGQTPQDFRLMLGGKSFDPLHLEALRAPDLTADAPELLLIQYSGPIAKEWPEELQALGLELISYIHPYSYVVWGLTSALNQARGATPIRFAGSFLPEWRLYPEWPVSRTSQSKVQLLALQKVGLEPVVSALQALGATELQSAKLGDRFYSLTATLPSSALAQVAAFPSVYAVQPLLENGGARSELAAQVDVNATAIDNQTLPGYLAYLDLLELNGDGAIIANVDSGVDQTHPDLVARMLPCDGDTCGPTVSSNHGTHTAALMAGDGGSGVVDGNGFLRGLGIAPGAMLVEQVFTGLETAAGITHLISESQRNGASISGNSWGPSSVPLGYESTALAVDLGVRDSNSDQAGNQPLTYVLSINNGFGGTSTQGTPDEAKNAITVGATRLQASIGTPLFEINDLANVTAQGPALDGRLLPLIVAPGCYVDSARVGNSYGTLCGTSMASPQVSGAAALFTQYYRRLTANQGQEKDPSPALIKAVFLPVAHDLYGSLDADGIPLGHRPDSKQGWGRLNIEPVIHPQQETLYYDAPLILDGSGEIWRTYVSPADFEKPMRIMLSWTDAPGNGLGHATPAWTNNLDLEVTFEEQLYCGNHFGSDGWSAPGEFRDEKNNSEGVLLGPTPPGLVSVVVRATNLPGDGIPGNPSLTDQDFALVCYNCHERISFDMIPSKNGMEACLNSMASQIIEFRPIGNFSENIHIELLDLPAGVEAFFSQQSISSHGVISVFLDVSNSAQPGPYQLQLVGTSVDSQTVETLEIPFHIFSEPPVRATLNLPAQWSNSEATRPLFQWNDLGANLDYLLEIATDLNFQQILYSYSTRATQFQINDYLQPFTSYFWRVTASNSCGFGQASAMGRFKTRLNQPILLVDDDNNAPDSLPAYRETLDALGLKYDVWNTFDSQTEPKFPDLEPYQLVIWFSGGTTNFNPPLAGPSEESELALGQFLDGGGNLLISSQDYLYDRGGLSHTQATSFMNQYFGMLQGTSNVTQTSISGNAAPFTGLGPFSLSYALPLLNRSDSLVAAPGGLVAFNGNNGITGLIKTTSDYRAAYLAFPLEALSSQNRQTLISAFLAGMSFSYPSGCLGDQDLWNKAASWPSTTLIELLGCLHQYQAY